MESVGFYFKDIVSLWVGVEGCGMVVVVFVCGCAVMFDGCLIGEAEGWFVWLIWVELFL